MSNLDAILENLKKYILPTEQEIKLICDKIAEILINLDNIAEIESPLIVCGDIRGQFKDLLEMFNICGKIPETNYLFLGNLTGNDEHNIETLLFLLILKLKYPNRITFLRGNKETHCNDYRFPLENECKIRFGNYNAFYMFLNVFDLFQIAAIVESKIFCIHGGICPQIGSLDDIKKLDRKNGLRIDSSYNPLFIDLLTSQPYEDIDTFTFPSKGVGYLFGEKALDEFNQKNNIEFFIRGHDLFLDGYQYFFKNKLISLWSAPNFRPWVENKAAIMEFDEHMNKHIKVFEACPHDNKNQQQENSIINEVE